MLIKITTVQTLIKITLFSPLVYQCETNQIAIRFFVKNTYFEVEEVQVVKILGHQKCNKVTIQPVLVSIFLVCKSLTRMRFFPLPFLL